MYNIEHIKNAKLKDAQGKHAYICEFLAKFELTPDTDADFTVNLINEDGMLCATGSLCANVIKYIAVATSEQGTGAALQLIEELTSHAANCGIDKLFLFTKPQNEGMFRSMSFYTLAKTESAVMMENDARGITRFMNSLKRPENCDDNIGCIVANCNPMTLGHLYLMERAAKECSALHVFILSEDRAAFSADARFEIVKNATAHIENLYLHRSSEYMISSATFPTYFIKDKASAENINADLDLTLFAERIAPALSIKKRYVGTEPYCKVTNAYNERMKIILPEHGISVCEIERKDGISASRVRELMAQGDMETLKGIVPKATYDYIMSHEF
ncbi:MAG: [Clostridia bacterium]|nr:[citrate (pro-3S)-lyase] ligase [Clostridia bacterium]